MKNYNYDARPRSKLGWYPKEYEEHSEEGSEVIRHYGFLLLMWGNVLGHLPPASFVTSRYSHGFPILSVAASLVSALSSLAFIVYFPYLVTCGGQSLFASENLLVWVSLSSALQAIIIAVNCTFYWNEMRVRLASCCSG